MYREPIVMGRKLGLKSMVWTRRKKENIQPEKNEKTRIQKNEERLRNLWDNFKCSNIWIIGVSEGEEEEQEIENLFEKVIENFLHLVKELDVQAQEAQRVPKKLDPRKQAHTKIPHNYITQDER